MDVKELIAKWRTLADMSVSPQYAQACRDNADELEALQSLAPAALSSRQGEAVAWPWIGPLGALVCAAKDRDASWAEQCAAIDKAHQELFEVLSATPPSDEAVRGVVEALAELTAWVDRAIVPGYTDRKPMPENCRKALDASHTALSHPSIAAIARGDG